MRTYRKGNAMARCILRKDYLDVTVHRNGAISCHREEQCHRDLHYGHSWLEHREYVQDHADTQLPVRRDPASDKQYFGRLEGHFRVWLEVSIHRNWVWPIPGRWTRTFYRRPLEAEFQHRLSQLVHDAEELEIATEPGAISKLREVNKALRQLYISLALGPIRQLVADERATLEHEDQARLEAGDERYRQVQIANALAAAQNPVIDDHIAQARDLAERMRDT
jgi:hypothetical protein